MFLFEGKMIVVLVCRGDEPMIMCFVCVCVLQEELEAQVSFLQGQINDLEAMSKYCGKMMNVHIGEHSSQSSCPLLNKQPIIMHSVIYL